MNNSSISTPTIHIDEVIKESLQTQQDNESQVIVHCYYAECNYLNRIRIWPSTFLIDTNEGGRSALLFAENISFMPTWTFIPPHKRHRFTLYFSQLPKTCTQFDLVEEIPEPGAFIVNNIQRNREDIYHLYL